MHLHVNISLILSNEGLFLSHLGSYQVVFHRELVVSFFVFDNAKTVPALSISLDCCIIPVLQGLCFILFDTITIVVRATEFKVRIG